MSYDDRILSDVNVLMALARAGTIVRASEALALSPSGVSRALARLEERIGVRLLDRTTRSMSLTDEGRRFYERIGPHLDGIEEAAIEASGSATNIRGRLRVNVDPFFSRIVLAAPLVTFIDSHPEIQLELIMRDSVGDLVADGFDLALRFGDPPSGTLIARKLIETRVLTVASPAYLEKCGRPKHPSELGNHRCLDFYDAAHGRPYEWEFHRKKTVIPVKFRSRFLVSDAGTMLGACEAGAGIAQILQLGTRHLIDEGRLIELFPEWSDEVFALHAIFASRHQLPAKVRAFIDFCLKAIAERG